MTTTNEGLIKLDCIGRTRLSREQRESLLDGYEASGLSGPQFCAQHGVKYQTFATWLQKRKRGDGRYPVPSAAPESKPLFLLAGVEESGDPSSASMLEIRLPGGACLFIRHAGEATLAAELLKRMAGGGAC